MGAQQAKDMASGSIKRKLGDKKKTSQNSKKDGEYQNDPDSVLSTNNNQWLSDENMADGVAEEDSENLFVALYDFQSSGEKQLDLINGEKVIVLEYNENKEWSWVEKKNNSVSTSGWIPTNHIASASSHSKFSWFHGPLSRNAAEYLLSSGITGSFLVRDSESCPGQMTISLRFEEKYIHYKIQRDINMVFVDEQQRFKSLDQLVKHYYKEPGLVTLLQFPVRRVNKPPIFALSPEMEEWEVERSEIEMKQQLGSGQYGDVYEAVWKRKRHKDLKVAVKTLRAESTALQDFMKEVTIMKEMKHQNLVQLLGICTWQPPYYIITEFMSQGNLLDYLRSSSPEELDSVILFYMATQIVSAMGYLEEKNFIHRDLAARNCLVGDNHLVKVADFGLARLVLDETYTAQTTCKFPIKWTAPEGLMYGSFSTKSDVWAFGILLWELATYGDTPYPTLELQNVYEFLEIGSRMACPPGCPSYVYELMLKCWKWEPIERPTFREIHVILNTFQKPDFSEDVEKKLGGTETTSDLVKTGTVVVSGNKNKESVSVTPPLGHVPKPIDFIPVKETQLSGAEPGARKPPTPPRKETGKDQQPVRKDLRDSRSSKQETVKEMSMNNCLIGHRNSLDESQSDSQKTLISKAKSLPPTPSVNPAVATGLRKTTEKNAIMPLSNDQHLNLMQFRLKPLPNPPAVETYQKDKSGDDASGPKYRTMPQHKLGSNKGTLEITSQGNFMPKKKAHSVSEACNAELESSSEDSGSAQLKQLTIPATLNSAENKLDSSRVLLKQNVGGASISGLSPGLQKAEKIEGCKPAIKPKPPIIGPKPTGAKPSQHTQTMITPL